MTKNVPVIEMRTESDALGALSVPVDALYGACTARALTNFVLSGRRLCDEPLLVQALAALKGSAAQANSDLDNLTSTHASAIVDAAREMTDGLLDAHLLVDLLEGSGGTSTNMNVNEVLANRALQQLGKAPGDYLSLSPNDHVNRSQSTNDVIPSAIKIACWLGLAGLIEQIDCLKSSFRKKSREFAHLPRLGRTCLQDAQPMTLGNAFGAYATLCERLGAQLAERRSELLELPLGATAIGTGLGAPKEFGFRAVEALRGWIDAGWERSADLFDGLANADGYARLSAELRSTGLALAKIANDFQILSSGPQGGFAELKLPEVQAGSSIMPGKVNPVIPMAVCQTAFAVSGNDAAIAQACQAGQLEINPYEPLIGAKLLDSIRLLTNAATLFDQKCVSLIEADADRMLDALMRSSAMATALLPSLGYRKASDLVKTAQQQGRRFVDVAIEAGVLDQDALDRLLLADK